MSERFRRVRTFLASILLMCALAQAQDTEIKIRFHVTSVSYAEDPDFCTTGKCTAKKYIVEGYTKSSTGTAVSYRLTCDEVRSTESYELTLACSSLHANTEYPARLFDASISFWPEVLPSGKTLYVNYDIVSEKEVSRPTR